MNVQKEVSALENMTVHELREKHVDVFGESTGSHNKRYLLKRISWRAQATGKSF